jgi:hypothetical protein
MQVQLSRLFGADSRMATSTARSDAEWRRDLKVVLIELYQYMDANINTDPTHRRMLDSGFAAADLALQGEDFWPGYLEGITRIALCLMGSYPDHRKRKGGSKKGDHYELNNDRAVTFSQNAAQRIHALCWTAPGIVELTKSPFEALHEFRDEVGLEVPIKEFLTWYKGRYPADYLKVF